MRLLISASACSAAAGSESLVGYRTIETLAEIYPTTVITSAGMHVPSNATSDVLEVRFDDPNDVSPWQLLCFELKQLSAFRRLSRTTRFDIFHRVTPAGWKPSLFSRRYFRKLVLGPILLSHRPPEAFAKVFGPKPSLAFARRFRMRRIQAGCARRLLESFGQPLIENADLIIAGSRISLDLVDESVRCRTRYLPYSGVEHQFFCPPTLPRGNPVLKLLFAGRLVAYKGVELLLRAVAVASRKRPMSLTIVGGAEAGSLAYYRQLSVTLGLADVVTFTPPVPREKLKSLYCEADIFCMPSIETYGLAVLEAMSCGCAVLVSDFNGPGEIVQAGTGVKVPLVDPEQFIAEYAHQILELGDSSNRRREFGQSAREHVIAHHDWADIRRKLVEYYDELLSYC